MFYWIYGKTMKQFVKQWVAIEIDHEINHLTITINRLIKQSCTHVTQIDSLFKTKCTQGTQTIKETKEEAKEEAKVEEKEEEKEEDDFINLSLSPLPLPLPLPMQHKHKSKWSIF
jgi:hypothetical protein